MTSVVLALGSNLGDRRYHLNAALLALRSGVTVTRVSSMRETAPVDCPAASPSFLNCVLVGHTELSADALLREVNAIEERLGRRRTIRNAPRTIDIDIIFYGAHVRRSKALTLPHPRYRERSFVMEPLRELRLPWCDPLTLQSTR